MFVIRKKDLLDNKETYLVAKPSKSEASDELHLYFKNRNVKLGPNKTDEGLFYEVVMNNEVPFGINKAIETKNSVVITPDGYILSGSREVKTEQMAEYDIVEIPATLVVNFLNNDTNTTVNTTATETQKNLVQIVYQPKSETIELFIADKEVMTKYKKHVETVIDKMYDVFDAIDKDDTVDAEPTLYNNVVASYQRSAEPTLYNNVVASKQITTENTIIGNNSNSRYSLEELKNLPINTLVDAQDYRGFWYAAKIIVPYNPKTNIIRVNYSNWGCTSNESIAPDVNKFAKYKSKANEIYNEIGIRAYNPRDFTDSDYLAKANYVYTTKNFDEIKIGDEVEVWENRIGKWVRKIAKRTCNGHLVTYNACYSPNECAKVGTFTTN